MDNEKRCTKCGEVQPLDQFHRDKNRRCGRIPHCKQCRALYQAAYYARPEVREKTRLYTEAHKEDRQVYLNTYSKRWQRENRDSVARIGRAWRDRHPVRGMVNRVKCRALKAGLSFNLDENDVVIPPHCPILGVPLFVCAGRGQPQDDSPSLDRMVPALGYVKGNVSVISWRANRLKLDGTAEEHEKIAAWMRSKGAL